MQVGAFHGILGSFPNLLVPTGRAAPQEISAILRSRFDSSLPPDRGPRVNERITIRQVMLIDAEGKNLGITATEVALRMAQEAGLDLVEVADRARPPVCKIMDYGKFKYEQAKKAHEGRTKQHKSKLKTLRLRPKTDPHILEIRVNAAREYLVRGDKVAVMIQFRGRELSHPEMGHAHCTEFAKRLEDVARVEQMPRLEGKRMTMLLGHK